MASPRLRASRWVRSLAIGFFGLVGSFAPLAAFFPVGVPRLWTVGAVALLAHALSAIIGSRATMVPLATAVCSLPFGDLMMAYIIVRATVLGARRGGLTWRGTVYPSGLLRAGRRVEM